ncbi:hypothetical protein [Pararobbsia silviterrae]|uniref:hypothetical protein n=1 Tax=Pararobbsia silviterrae TaxID=1792498 RepID=UPI0011C3895A|nr:hypothetical protein [Pararobbsia silviterrae]
MSEVDVGGSNGMMWVPAVDIMTVGRIYRIQVLPDGHRQQRWFPDGVPAAGCTADGAPTLSRNGSPLVMPELAVGALIGRIGGSTADDVVDKERMFVFSIGQYCVFQVPEVPKAGALFLTGNEARAFVNLFKGTLKVSIEQAL